jgi:hypothetical protein
MADFRIQTRTIASIAPRATSLARSPTSPGHGWPSHLPCRADEGLLACLLVHADAPVAWRDSLADNSAPSEHLDWRLSDLSRRSEPGSYLQPSTLRPDAPDLYAPYLALP